MLARRLYVLDLLAPKNSVYLQPWKSETGWLASYEHGGNCWNQNATEEVNGAFVLRLKSGLDDIIMRRER
jgi:hypothetical protein